jgi:hypothetical protein
MHIALTASSDACQLSASCREDETILWLRPRSAGPSRAPSWGRRTLLNLTTSFGLGACLAMTTATAATAPSEPAEARIVLPASAEIDLSDLKAEPAPAADPLQSIVPEPAASVLDAAAVQQQIILSMPLTHPPVAEGAEDDDQLFADEGDHVAFEEMRVPRWIVDTILRASEATGADPVYMMALADKESSFIPANRAATSSAEGLFQFITSTWLHTVRTFGAQHGLAMEAAAIETVNGQLTVPNEEMRAHILGLRRNPYISALMAAEMMKRDKAKIESRLGRKLSRSEFYLSHFFGVDSASKFIALVDDTPKKSAPSVFPAAAKSNKALFFAQDGKKTRQLSVAEVYGRIDTMIDKRLDRYEDVSARATAEASLPSQPATW